MFLRSYSLRHFTDSRFIGRVTARNLTSVPHTTTVSVQPIFPVKSMGDRTKSRETPTISDTSTVIQPSSVSTAIAGSSSTLSDIESMIERISTNPPDVVTLLSSRSSILRFRSKLSASSLITAMELFTRAGVPDHMFVKECGRSLQGSVSSFSVSDLDRLLRVHASLGVSQSYMLSMISDRLIQIIGRANIQEIESLLSSLSSLGPGLSDSAKMIDLCLNRYSLSTKDNWTVETDLGVLRSLANARLRNKGVIRRIQAKLAKSPLTLPQSASAIQCLSALNVDSTSLWLRTKSAHLANLRVISDTSSLATIVSCMAPFLSETDPVFLFRACAILSESNEPDVIFKSLFGLRVIGAFTPTASLMRPLLSRLDTSDLKRIANVLEQEAVTPSFEVKEPTTSFIKTSAGQLERTLVGGIFSTNLWVPKVKKVAGKRVKSEK